MSNTPEIDVLVIGGGAAGVAAARAASERGARTWLVSESHGATAVTSGWIAAGETGVDGEALAWLESVGLRPLGAYAFATSAGALASAISGLASLLELTEIPDGPVGVVDLVAGAAWSADLVARSLEPVLQRSVRVIVPGDGAPRGASTLELAHALDTEGLVDALASSLRDHLGDCCALLFPPVLGLTRDDVATRLAARLGCPVGETGGTSLDPTAFRVARAIERGVPARVERLNGRATMTRDFSVRVDAREMHPRAIVLATGGLLAGGIVFDGDFVEPCAKAPVWLPSASGSMALGIRSAGQGLDPLPLFAPDQHGRTRAARAGVRVGADLRVLGPDGARALDPRLFAAGSVLAGASASYGCTLAEALASGHRAGLAAARFASER